jgi:hypothetical protein
VSQVGAVTPTPPLSVALGFCLSEGSLPRAKKRLAGEGCRPTPPLFAALGTSYRRLTTAGNEALGRWGQPLPPSRFPLRSAVPVAHYRGQRNTRQVEAAAPTLPLSAALGVPCRRLATAGDETLGRWGLPSPTPPLSAALGLSCRWLATAGNEALGRWGLHSACLADGSLHIYEQQRPWERLL